MSFVEAIKGELFEPNRFGFICALSRTESSSDLRQDDSYISKTANNNIAREIVNSLGYMGYFQFGKIALQTVGFKDANGNWTGLDGASSQEKFLTSREIQIKAVNRLINENCKLLRNNNFNEYYGKTINGVELTESGVIAGCHLVGLGGLAAFLDVPNNLKFVKKKINGKWVVTDQKHPQYDGNKVHISEYIRKFNNYDLESCCPRKVRITFNNGGVPLVGAEITIKSTFSGKLYAHPIIVKHKTNEEGKIPVIVRHPKNQIVLTVQGKDSEVIEQGADKTQNKIINVQGKVNIAATLGSESQPQPKPQPDKSPQDQREQASTSSESNNTNQTKDIQFNISIVEGDSGRAITSLRFYVTYKGNIKEHRTDQQGIKQGIVAEEGQDIEVSVAGEGGYQVIHHFKVSSAMNSQTIKIKLPVQSFEILVKKDGKPVPNTLFSVFYRSREIAKRTNAQGMIKVKMLIGFVYGLGIHERALTHVRVIKGNARREFTVNENTVKASKLFEQAAEKQKQANPLNAQQQAQDKVAADKAAADAKKARDAAEKAKADQEKAASNQQDTHTQNNGKPLTTVGAQAPATSDTTRYHIYHDGKIKRENKAATGFAEFIYYEANGTQHNLGKSAFIVANKYENYKDKSGNTQYRQVNGSSYLIDYSKHNVYKSGGIGYKWLIVSEDKRFYLSGLCLSVVLGAMLSLGYAEYHGSGFSKINGSPGASVSHINGNCGDFRYIGTNNSHMSQLTYVSHNHFDWDKNVRFVETLWKFGFKSFLSMPVKIKGNILLPRTTSHKNHHNHIHLQRLNPNVEDI